MSITITVVINNCGECRHVGHSGAFTKGGAKAVCHHDDAVETATRNKSGIIGDDKYHWKYRVIKDRENKIPGWCPLKHGSRY